jgi:uncharacterized protein (TIGR02466 family)
MKIIKNEWWPTPTWEVETDFDSAFNEKLLEEISHIKHNDPNKVFNIWDYPGENLQILKQLQIDIIKEQTKEYFDHYIDMQVLLHRGWLNVNIPGTSMAIHDHGDAKLASTYYIQTEDNCGDLILVDPRGSHEFRSEEKTIFKRMKPIQSRLIFFPGFITHMVEENKSYKPRISLSSNVLINADGINNVKNY